MALGREGPDASQRWGTKTSMGKGGAGRGSGGQSGEKLSSSPGSSSSPSSVLLLPGAGRSTGASPSGTNDSSSSNSKRFRTPTQSSHHRRGRDRDRDRDRTSPPASGRWQARPTCCTGSCGGSRSTRPGLIVSWGPLCPRCTRSTCLSGLSPSSWVSCRPLWQRHSWTSSSCHSRWQPLPACWSPVRLGQRGRCMGRPRRRTGGGRKRGRRRGRGQARGALHRAGAARGDGACCGG